MQTETLMRTMSTLLSRIATPADFSPAVSNETLVSWLTDPEFHLPNGGILGLCCSSLLGLQFQEDGGAGTAGLITDFRRFLLAASLAHSGWRDGNNIISSRDLCAAGQISGCRLIRRLDRVLTPQFLSRCGREACQVLFLLVLGATLGVGYASSQLEHHSPEFPSEMLNPEFQRSPTLWLAMKEHLCQMLAHHLIHVGSMLGIKLDTDLEQRIIDTAIRRWNKAELFVWANAMASGGEQLRAPRDPVGPQSGAVRRDEGEEDAVIRSHSSPSSRPDPPRSVPIRFEEAAQLQRPTVDYWSQNPQSYLAMFEEPGSLTSLAPGSNTYENQVFPTRSGPEPRLETKRRSIWIVQPFFDAGLQDGPTNVHARLRCSSRGMGSLGAFV